MASTSTNKQPCLIDRPFFRGAVLNASTPIITEAQSGNPPLTSLIQLLRVGDLPSEDAAVVEDIALVSNESYSYQEADVGASGVTNGFGLYIYMPNQAAPATSAAVLIGRYNVDATVDFQGFPQEIPLFGTTAPVPQFNNLPQITAGSQIRPVDIGKNEVIYLEKGYILCVGYLGPKYEGSGLTSAGVSVVTQGGFY